MNRSERRFLAWPGWEHLRFAWLLTALVTLWFGMVFVAGDRIAAQHSYRVRVHFGFEPDLPLVPAFTAVYMSIYLLFLGAPFVLRVRREISELAEALALAILIAGIGFLLIPAKLAFPTPTNAQLGVWTEWFSFADRLNLDYNLVPSLHVGLSIICIESLAGHAGPAGKLCLRTWGVLIAVSTLLLHQHHLLDVLTGYLLALAVVTLVRWRKSKISAS